MQATSSRNNVVNPIINRDESVTRSIIADPEHSMLSVNEYVSTVVYINLNDNVESLNRLFANTANTEEEDWHPFKSRFHCQLVLLHHGSYRKNIDF